MRIDWDYVIVVGALAVAAPRYGEAFVSASGVSLPPAWYAVSGLVQGIGMALALEGGAWRVFRAWSQAQKNPGRRSRWLAFFLISLLVLAPVVQAPLIAAHLVGISLAEWLGGLIAAWAFLIAAAPFWLIGAVSYAHRESVRPAEKVLAQELVSRQDGAITRQDDAITRQDDATLRHNDGDMSQGVGMSRRPVARGDRLAALVAALSQGKALDATETAATWGISLRQAQRDLATARKMAATDAIQG